MNRIETFGPKPNDYAGYWPAETDILVMVRHRDSALLDKSNFDAARKRLEDMQRQLIDKLTERRKDTIGHRKRAAIDDMIARAADAIILWRARHWACGWVEYLGLKANAPSPLKKEAERIKEELDVYPALDEDAYEKLQWEHAHNFWETLDEEERAYMLRRYVDDPEEAAKQDGPPVEFLDAAEIY